MKNKVVVVGASGLIGLAAIEAFLAAGWDVIGISRRKPELPSGRDFRFIPVDLRDEKTARQALSPLADVTHVAYTALYENADDLVSGVYANVLMIGHSASEFYLDFITNFYPRSAVCCRVYFSAPQIPGVLNTLTRSYQQFQQKLAAGQPPNA